MTAYDWLMGAGALAIIAFLVKAFWRAHKIEPVEQPDNWHTSTGGGTGPPSP